MRCPGPTRATTAVPAEAAAAIWASRRTFTAGKQRLTATRLWELLRDDGHDVSGRTVRRLVASFRSAEREVTVPLVYGPGELAQVDFFEVWVEVESVRQKAWLFLMRLMHSGRDFTCYRARRRRVWRYILNRVLDGKRRLRDGQALLRHQKAGSFRRHLRNVEEVQQYWAPAVAEDVPSSWPRGEWGRS